MNPNLPRVVYDCNIYVQSLININGPAGRCIQKAQLGAVSLFVSEFVLHEIRRSHLRIPGKYGVTQEQTETLASAISSLAMRIEQLPAIFTYQRDPDDAHYVNLALADPARPDAIEFQRLFPNLRILEPVQFLRELDMAQKT